MAISLKLNFKKENLIKNRKVIIGTAIALIAVWYGYTKIYKNTVTSMQKINSELYEETINADISKRLATLQGEIEGYRKYFAKETDIVWLTDKISKAANASGLKIVSLNSKPMVSMKSFLYSTVNVVVNGTFHQLGDFVSNIENFKEFIHIEKLTFKKNEGLLSADLIIATYFWK